MPDPRPTPSPLDYASRGTRVPKAPLGRPALLILGLSLTLGGLCLGTFALLPRDGQQVLGAQGGLRQISILRSGIDDALPLLLPAGFALLLVGGIVLLYRRRIALGTFALLGAIFASIFSLAVGVLGHLAHWRLFGQVTASDGQRYCFIDSSFLQGQTMAIARMKSAGLLYVTMDVLGTTNGDSPRSYLLVVRPAPVTAGEYGDLRATADGLVVGLRYENECYMVYDITSNTFHGHGDVERLSPFLLLDENSALHAPDEAGILKAIGRAAGNAPGPPDEAVLRRALDHPNPAVRQSADTILKAMKRQGAQPSTQP